MCAPTSADASATWRVPMALTVKAASTSDLAPIDRGEGTAVEHELGSELGEGVHDRVPVVDAHGVDVGAQYLVVEPVTRPFRARAARSGGRRLAPVPPERRAGLVRAARRHR